MATAQKISQLTTAGPLTGAELVPIVQTSGTLQTTVSIIASYAVVTLALEVSAFGTRVEQVSAAVSVNTAVVASVQADVSALDVRVAAVSASVSALQVQVNSVSTALTSTNNVVSALEVRVSSVSTAVSALTTRVALVSSSVSALQIQLNSVSAALTSTNNVVSALEVRVSSVSAAASANAASIVSTNAVISALDVRVSVLEVAVSNIGNVSAIAALLPQVSNLAVAVSALEIRVSSVSSQVSTNTLAITSINNVVSALDIRVAAVSALTSVNAAAVTSINAVVSTKVNRVGDYMDSVQYIEFDTSTITATSVGRLVWDTEYGTLDLGLAGGNSNVLIGQREVMYVYNDTAATLTKGKVVEVTGAQGQRLTVKLAQADSDSNSATVLGVMLETVSVNASGYVATNGIVRNVNTSGFTDGQIVYLSPTTAGDLTVTKPVAPQHLVMIGYIVKGGSVGAGSIYVKTQNGYELGELHDVKVSSSLSIANGEILAYDTSANVWTNSMALINTQASVSVLQIQVNAVSAATSVNAAAIAAVSASVSALQVQVNNVSAALTSTNNVVSALEVRVSSASATGVTNAAAITSINNVVSALEIRVSTVSAQASAVQAQVNAVSVLVSALDLRVTNVSASVSALQVQLNNVSAGLTSTNNVVSALEIRVSTVSAVAAATKTQVDAVSVLVSALQVQVNTVSAVVSQTLVSVGQRVLRAGDTMTGNLNISTSADAQAVSVAGYATFTSRVSISAGFYTGLQNYQDFTVQRPTFRDYGLVVVAKGSVSSVVSLDLTEGNYFEAIAAGSSSFVFVSPPVSVAGVAGRAAGGFILELQNGGAATVTWPAAVKWPGGTAPTLTTSGFDVLVFITDDGGTTWRGVQSMKDSK